MWISRIQVSGGFLDGLDLRFERGLNVLIGGRGSGKTSILELLRHALNLAHANPVHEKESREFIRAVLGPGEVTVDLADDLSSTRLIVDGDGSGRRAEVRHTAIMVGQNELEAIASDAPSRLSLLDIRAGIEAGVDIPAAVGRLTLRLRELRQEKVELDESIRRLPELRQQLAQAQRRETELLSANESSLEPQRAELREIEASVLRIRRGGSQVEDYASELRRLHDGLDAFNERVVALRSITVPQSFRDWVATIQERVEGLVKALYEVLQEGEQSAESQRTSLAQGEQRLLELAAPLKEQLSEAEDGLGQVSAEIRALGSQIESLESLEVESGQLESELARIGGQRDGLLDEVEEQLERVFDSRAGVAKEVTSQLGAKAAIRVEHLADVTRLAEYLTNALRGSGIQYRAVVERLCAAYLPRTLLQAVESGDAEGIASAAGIQVERAFRVLQALDTPSNLVELANLTLDDRADYFLLHGSEMKNVDQLSTGQKCAVTLPILMTELDRALLLDQPEDHLDNEFLVQNVLPGLARRAAAHAQTIVATHNANIPVLGEADKVVALSSDGKRGFVSIEGSLDDKPVVTVIEAVMEGGVDAFKERARFYAASEGR